MITIFLAIDAIGDVWGIGTSRSEAQEIAAIAWGKDGNPADFAVIELRGTHKWVARFIRENIDSEWRFPA